jgi:hypothetical protein
VIRGVSVESWRRAAQAQLELERSVKDKEHGSMQANSNQLVLLGLTMRAISVGDLMER